jgi:mono/diheme cytochrome c family protein
MKKINSILVLIILIFFFSGCGKKNEVTTDKKPEGKTETNQTSKPDAELVKEGKDLFYTASKETGLKCADCHSDGTNDNIAFTKFHSSVLGAAKRTSVYNGMFKGADVSKNACGATVCWKTYLKYDTPLTDEQVKSLNAYYESVSKGNEKTELGYTTIAVPDKDKAKLKDDQAKIASLTGDVTKGETLFKDACSFCHGKNSTVKKVPSLAENKDVNLKSIIYQIRMGSKYMPFYTYESLSNQNVADICAFILKSDK